MNDEELLNQTRRALDDANDGLDGATLSRLRRARALAVERATRRPLATAFLYRFAPAAAFAAVAAIAIGVVFMLDTGKRDHGSDNLTAALADLEMLAADEAIVLDDELDFYRWLDAAQHAG